jgi:hypothetical protein
VRGCFNESVPADEGTDADLTGLAHVSAAAERAGDELLDRFGKLLCGNPA